VRKYKVRSCHFTTACLIRYFKREIDGKILRL
jgi:hypothetical protein